MTVLHTRNTQQCCRLSCREWPAAIVATECVCLSGARGRPQYASCAFIPHTFERSSCNIDCTSSDTVYCLCLSVCAPYVEAVPALSHDDPLVDPAIDGKPFDNDILDAELLSRYPYWLRGLILVSVTLATRLRDHLLLYESR